MVSLVYISYHLGIHVEGLNTEVGGEAKMEVVPPHFNRCLNYSVNLDSNDQWEKK